MKECMMIFQLKQQTESDINALKVNSLTLDDIWDPKMYFVDPAEELHEYSKESDENKEEKEITESSTPNRNKQKTKNSMIALIYVWQRNFRETKNSMIVLIYIWQRNSRETCLLQH